MKPELLVIKNIGPFRGSHTVDFTTLGDIFLVYGKTGAGKTTIFDAISYAFYGKAPGGRNGLERSMRSQFATDGEEAGVALTFTTGGKRYRIARTLAYEKTGARSGKTVPVLEEATLEEDVIGTWVNRSSTKKSETDLSILGIIKLSVDEFSRIVLLPQGEFARFLRLNSNDRKDVLSKLFPIGQYTRVIDLARNRTKEASARVNEIESAAILLSAEFNSVSYIDDRASLVLSTERARAAQGALRKKITDDSAMLEKSRAAYALADREKDLMGRLAAFESKQEAINASRLCLALARKASPLVIALAAIEEMRMRRERSRSELTALESERLDLIAKRDELASREGAIAGRSREKDALHVRKERLEAAVRIATSLESLEGTYQSHKKEIDAEKNRLASIEADIAAYGARLAALESDAIAMEARSDAFMKSREEKDRLVKVRELSLEYERERKSRDTHRETVRLSAEAEKRNRQDFAIAKLEFSALETEAERDRIAMLASHLAASLQDGTPCPVCGSLTHPAPAHATAADDFPLSERIESGKRAIERLEEEYIRFGKEKATRAANLATAEARLDALASNPAFGGNVPSPESAQTALDEAIRITQETSDSLARSRTALRDSNEIRARSARDEAALPAIRERVSELMTAMSALKAEISHEKSRYREAFPADGVPKLGVPSNDVSAGAEADAADELEKCEASIIAVEAEISLFESSRSETLVRLSGLDGKKSELEKSIAALETDIAAKEAAFNAKATEASFAGAESVHKAARSADDQLALETQISAHDRELESAKTLLDRTRTERALWQGPSPEALEKSLADTGALLDETGRSLEESASELSALDALKARYDAIESERAVRSIEAGRLKRLADDLTGVNPAKTGFDAWILGMYLDEITAFANERLVRMSEGRYRIMLNGNYRKGNSLAGLELEILDAHTGRARPTGTLSGGETFMTSISLALGLADSIQSRAGGIQLDAVFIDEGFGSLDESSLERAIGILDEIRGSRMVGLISHVGELRDRIPNRIEVIKTGAGSEIRMDVSGELQ